MGNEVFNSVLEATGLPKELVSRELEGLLAKKGISIKEVTVEDLRGALSEYLRDVILKAKDAFDQGIELEEEVNPNEFR
ncbi:MAG: hypothetical protein IPM57_04635 [Oligoflexia bacterium]|nr:hypothetical protein [Oligoflexia bacterium]